MSTISRADYMRIYIETALKMAPSYASFIPDRYELRVPRLKFSNGQHGSRLYSFHGPILPRHSLKFTNIAETLYQFGGTISIFGKYEKWIMMEFIKPVPVSGPDLLSARVEEMSLEQMHAHISDLIRQYTERLQTLQQSFAVWNQPAKPEIKADELAGRTDQT